MVLFNISVMKKTVVFIMLVATISIYLEAAQSTEQFDFMIPSFLKTSVAKVEDALIKKYGLEHKERIQRGVRQVALFWKKEDGDKKSFESFVMENFLTEPEQLRALLKILEEKFETLFGHMFEIQYEFRRELDLDTGKIIPLYEILGTYDPAAHVDEDFISNKLAFFILLNFPIATFEERKINGDSWSRQRWAEDRLTHKFSKRIPSKISQEITAACNRGELYTSEYKIWMHHVLGPDNERLFPKGLKLISHWNLRDEIRAQYGRSDGLIRQQVIQKVMERIIDQSIPQIVINNPAYDWNPFTNLVKPADSHDAPSDAIIKSNAAELSKTENNKRYEILLNIFKAIQAADKYCPFAPNFIQRKFNENRQISESEVEKMLDCLLSSPLLKEIAGLIEKRIGRNLEPFDIWYNGFSKDTSLDEAYLDTIVSKKFPTAESFKKEIPNILLKLGFSKEQAEFLYKNIEVEPSRGTGHAMGHLKRGSPVRLRTRFEKNGMNYKSFNIAMHELGHNVEQVFSLNNVDHYFLLGVPNNACTEAIAYVFQNRNLEVLGFEQKQSFAPEYNTIQTYWAACELAAVALVEMKIWRWLYSNPKATPEELKKAVLKISREIWNKYYSNVIGKKDVTLLGIYSHMLYTPLYLADYPLGFLISYQIEEKLKKSESLGKEIERITSFGNLTPDLWMIHATGKPLSTEPLLKATAQAIKKIRANR